MQAPGATTQDRLNELPEPTWRLLVQRGLPQFVVEGVLPVLVFYGVWRAGGLAPAVVVSTLFALVICAWLVREGRNAGLAVLSAVFVVVQALVALAAHSTTVYLAQPVVLSGLWGLVYVGSVLMRRPLIGVSRAPGIRSRVGFGRAHRSSASLGCSRSSGARTVSVAPRFGSTCSCTPAWAGSSSSLS